MLTSIALLFGVCVASQADQGTVIGATATPESVGFSTARLERINERMREAVDAGVMVGGHAIIAKDNQLVFDEHWGMADREAERPMRGDALYRIYSMTKPVTAVALMMLYEQGLFLLEDPVAKYLPELANLRLAVVNEDVDGQMEYRAPQRQPTIRDLLRHTAGLTYGLFSDTAVDKAYRDASLLQASTLEEFVDRLGKLPLLLEPGTRWHYSVSVDVQGRLVEVLSGQRLSEFTREKLFAPLDMDDTFFVVPEDKRSRMAQLYTPKGTEVSWNALWKFTTVQELEPASAELSQGYYDGSLFESGGAGLVSSAHDYLRFALMLANGGELDGVRILAPRTIEHMRADHIQGVDSVGLWAMDAFGLGVGITADTSTKSGELGANGAYGWGGAAGTNFWVDPVDKIVGVFMVQSVPHQTDLAKKFRVLTYQALVK
ncbi:MAG: serine hydrolase domain-containing protein [Congregibacter sp.]